MLKSYRYSNLLYWVIFILAFTSSAPTDPNVRSGLEDAGFNLFKRYIGDIVSIWDLLFFLLLFIVIFKKKSSDCRHNTLTRAFGNRYLNSYFLFLILSVIVGLLIILTTQIESFYIVGWFRATVPVLYIIGSYYLVVNMIKSEDDLDKMWFLLERIAGLMVLYGFIRLLLILNGNIQTLVVEGVPIILYSELAYFDLPIIIYVLRVWHKKPLGLLRWIMLICMIGFIIASTRRYNYIQLLLNLIIAFLAAKQAKLLTLSSVIKSSHYFFLLLLLLPPIVAFILPDLAEAFLFSVQTINVFSEEGFLYTGEFRLSQLKNIFLNMEEVPITFVTGFGIGSQWHEIEPLPTTIDELGSYMAYDAKVMSQSHNNYLPYFHILYFSSIFRFGLVGSLILIVIAYRFWSMTQRVINVTYGVDRKILIVGLSALSLLPILYLGDNAAVVTWITLGINFGLIRSTQLLHLNKVTLAIQQ